jgi:predicted RNA binding protein YcfA (HicA-like mRNA interferase family)
MSGSVTFESLIRASGFDLDRTKGSHRIYRHRSGVCSQTIQPNGDQAEPYQVRQFLDKVEKYRLEMIKDQLWKIATM